MVFWSLLLSKMLEVGLKYQSRVVVSENNTALKLGSGDMAVFATPAMIALMENAAMNAVAEHLDAGATTVGTMMCGHQDRSGQCIYLVHKLPYPRDMEA